MYYNVSPKLDKGEAGVLGTAEDFPACQTGFKWKKDSQRNIAVVSGAAGCVAIASTFRCHWKKQAGSAVGNSSVLRMHLLPTGTDCHIRFFIKPKGLYFSNVTKNRKRITNFTNFWCFLYHPELVPVWRPIKYIPAVHTCLQTASRHADFNCGVVFNLCNHFQACSDLKADLIRALRCWANICMFQSNKWKALERLWLGMLSARKNKKRLLVCPILEAHAAFLSTLRCVFYWGCYFDSL